MLKRIGFGILPLLLIALLAPPFTVTIASEKENLDTRLESQTYVQTEDTGPTDTSIAQAVDWWPMFHHDLSHTGYSTSTAPNTNQTLWSYTTGSAVVSSPAVADGRVYVGSNDYNFYCLDASTGDFIWSYLTGYWVYSSPAVADGRVYVGSYDNNVYCFDALTGAYIWSYPTGSYVVSSPAVVDGRVYVGSWDYNVFCLDALTGAYIWSYPTGSYVRSSPAVADGRVYVGSDDWKVWCLDALTGAYIWNYTTWGPIGTSSPAVVDGRVYVGSCDSWVYCLNASTGAQVWKMPTGNYVVSSPAVADGRVYVGSDDWKVYCFDALTGAYIWSYPTGSYVRSSPAVVDGRVYVGSWDNNFYCLNASTGRPIWTYTTDNCVRSSPAVADGRVYVGSDNWKVYAFGSLPGIHDVAVANVTLSKTVIGKNYTTSFWVTVENQGDFSETFNISLYANTTLIEHTPVTLPSGNLTDVVFTWDTSGFSKGNYNLKAEADIVPGETDTTDNTYIDGWVIVSMIGDITGPDGWPDGKCDMRDVGMVARGFGANRITNETDPRYGEYWHSTPCDSCPHSPNCDVIYDGKIDMKDVGTTARHFGETDP